MGRAVVARTEEQGPVRAGNEPDALGGADAQLGVDAHVEAHQNDCATAGSGTAVSASPRQVARTAASPSGTRSSAARHAAGTPRLPAITPTASAANGRFPRWAI